MICCCFVQDSCPFASNLIIVDWLLQQWGRRYGSEKHLKVTGRCCSEANFCPGDWHISCDGHMKSKSFPMMSAFSGSRVGISHQIRLYKKKETSTQEAEMLFYSWTDYSAALSVLRNARSYPGLQWEGSSVHHRQGCKKAQRGESSPSFALSPRTSFSFFLFFLHNLFWECLHGILINSGKYFCVRDIICLIQMTAWLSTVLVLSRSDWYKMAMLFLEFQGFFLFLARLDY